MSIGGVHNLAYIRKNQDFNTFQGLAYNNAMDVWDTASRCPMLFEKDLRT